MGRVGEHDVLIPPPDIWRGSSSSLADTQEVTFPVVFYK